MKRFVIEFWFRRKFFEEKDFDEAIIYAKTKEQAIKTLRTIKGQIYSPKVISETLMDKN
jgi:hypothetical protein